jgi:hypothetical protein
MNFLTGRATISRRSATALAGILAATALQISGLSATYHVDSTTGDDQHSGTDPAEAWRSLDRVNAHVFQPGDRLLFRSEMTYVGQLKPQGSGRMRDGQPVPIVVDRFGEGSKPRIDAQGRFPDAVLLHNVEYWEINGLRVSNQGTNREPWRTGVRLLVDHGQTVRHLRLRQLFVHDVNGDLRKSHEGCGIFFEAREEGSRFDGVLIEDCHLLRTDRNGICQRRSRHAGRSTNVVIRQNLLMDIGGDAIKPWGSDGALVEFNIVRGARTRCEDYAAGIWPWDCDDTIIQFNDVAGVKGTKDGQAFDSDYRCRRSTFQYNYSHNNEGGFFLVCSPGTSWNEDTIIRYNLSQNDGSPGARIFHFAGNPQRTQVYHNTIYVGPGRDLPMVLCTEWDGGWSSQTAFRNNIFFVEGRVNYELGRSRDWIWENNVFFGRHDNRPADALARTERPSLLAPGTAGDHIGSLKVYQFNPSLPPWRGVAVRNNGGRDFFGYTVPENSPTVGAFEWTQPERPK